MTRRSGSWKHFLSFSILLSFGPGSANAQNGTCISSPQSACTSLVGICVSKIATGQLAKNNFWSAPECFAAATCAGSAAVIDAACCAGTCVTLASINSLDYNKVYAPMVGSCAFAPNGCPVTWTDFVNYFYNTIQTTNTNNWPISGNDVLAWWADIATWTGVCPMASSQLMLTYACGLVLLRHSLRQRTNSVPQFERLAALLHIDRDNNTDLWDPVPNGPCPFNNASLCFDDNTPQEPPDPTEAPLQTRQADQTPRRLAAFKIVPKPGLTALSLNKPGTPLPRYFPPNTPPPVYISNGTEKVQIPLNLTGGTIEKRNYSLVERTPLFDDVFMDLEKRPAVRSDVCRGPVDTPSRLPVLTYYCDYLPNICASIRGSGFLTNDAVVLTYDPFSTSSRRNSVSCDEFPFKCTLEGGKANGAIVTAVPEKEQQYQGTLNTALSKLRRVPNDARTEWSRPGKLKGKWAGQCHKFTLKLVDTRPATAGPLAVGSLYSGSAWLNGQDQDHTEILEDERGRPPPLPRAPYDYPSDAIALQPTNSYNSFDCRPCTIGSVNPVPAPAAVNVTRTTKPREVEEDVIVPRAATCTKSKPTSTPTPSSDAQTNAAEAVAAAAAAKAALSALSGTSPAISSAASAAVQAAQDVNTAAAAAAAAAVANNPAAMASTIGATIIAQNVLQSTIASLTDIFGTGTIPASVASIISSVSTVASDASSILTDTWNQKPAQSNPVPPDGDPSKSPTTNSAGGSNVAPAACFGPGSSGSLTINGNFFFHSTGTATEKASIADAGNKAYFGLNLANDGQYHLTSLCSGVYGWDTGTSPSFQVGCSSKEFGSYWNTVKQTCYAVPQGDNTFGISIGLQAQVTAVSFTWS
ncbi:putative chitin synthase [Mycena indigotica]|uniref:Putative chitin synthase n=1 Tax=Mycena indigotica TaxID=2126181 RepID=A0A8H6S3J5_9AGAR|nr:putative chitin synthase [Mycena indigotica]KAF7292048.1 putative chitin synthase [Mycena indigotica]